MSRCIFLCFLLGNCDSFATSQKISVHVLFEQGSTQVQTAFKYALHQWNETVLLEEESLDLQICAHLINVIDTTNIFGERRCDHFEAKSETCSPEVFLVVGIDISSEILNTLLLPHLQDHEVAFITSASFHAAVKNSEVEYYKTINLEPDFQHALIDTVSHYGWTDIIYLYHSQYDLMRLEWIFQELMDNSIRIKYIKQVSSVEDAVNTFMQIEMADGDTPKYIILDCPAMLTQEILTRHTQAVKTNRCNYHFLLAGLTMDEQWEPPIWEYGGINITGFRIIDPSRLKVRKFLSKWNRLDSMKFPKAGRESISGSAALMHDSISVLWEALSILKRDRSAYSQSPGDNEFHETGNEMSKDHDSAHKKCQSVLPSGTKLMEYIRNVELEGLTGSIRFTEKGRRYGYTIDVMEMTVHSPKVKIGEWSDNKGFLEIPAKFVRDPLTLPWKKKNRTYIEEPYLMYQLPHKGETLQGNDRFIGFCKDLADLLGEKLGIKHEIRLVKDGKYGSQDENGEWVGMIGELTRRETDMVIAPLTITLERENAIDFSKPYMSLGISIMAYKPEKQSPGRFSFLSPLSNEIWLCVILAYIAVSIVLFLVTRFNPNEWSVNTPTTGQSTDNHISKDPAWFSLAAFVQQGNGVYPRSIAGRMVASVWYFFILILISSYTANFAAVRTVNRMVTPINSVEDLVAQNDVEYGTMMRGSTMNFFKGSQIQTYAKMWDYMKARPHTFVRSTTEGIRRVRKMKGKYIFLIESPKNEYINGRKPCNTMKIDRNLDAKGFGVATPFGSPLKHQVNLAILSMQEDGTLIQLKKKWWVDLSECPEVDKDEASAFNEDELSFESIAGIFDILILGGVLSLTIAGLEYYFCNSKREPERTLERKEKLNATSRLSKHDESTSESPQNNTTNQGSLIELNECLNMNDFVKSTSPLPEKSQTNNHQP